MMPTQCYLLIRRLKDSGYTFVTLNPGYVKTEIHGENVSQVGA